MSRSARLGDRLAHLGEALEAAEGRADAEVLASASEVVKRAGQRVAFGEDLTVIALAGATGSGKSSLFNSLTGTSLAEVGSRRPTTGKAMAVGWGTKLPHELLDWLDITKRHLLPTGADNLPGLVLLDLPDHDSTEASHRLSVDNLVGLVDALIWVVDPQKYADALLHDNYLRPMAAHASVIMVVLNQSDLLPPAELHDCLADLRGILDSEGLRASPIVAVSALHGTGVEQLRTALERTVSDKQAMVRRLEADLVGAATALRDDLGQATAAGLDRVHRQAVVRHLGEAAGVSILVRGVRQAWRLRGDAATGWPPVAWLSKVRPDPLRKFRVDIAPGEHRPVEVNRTSLPRPKGVQRARVDQALRELVDAAAKGLPQGWRKHVRAAAAPHPQLLFDRLDNAVAATDLKLPRRAWWWPVFGLLQWLLLIAAVVGAGWLLANPVLAGFGLPGLPPVEWYDVPVGIWLLAGGLLGGLLLSILGRALVAVGANTRARVARQALERAIAEVAKAEVFNPVSAELDRHRTAVAEVSLALS